MEDARAAARPATTFDSHHKDRRTAPAAVPPDRLERHTEPPVPEHGATHGTNEVLPRCQEQARAPLLPSSYGRLESPEITKGDLVVADLMPSGPEFAPISESLDGRLVYRGRDGVFEEFAGRIESAGSSRSLDDCRAD
jgi:hypothetical protein